MGWVELGQLPPEQFRSAERGGKRFSAHTPTHKAAFSGAVGAVPPPPELNKTPRARVPRERRTELQRSYRSRTSERQLLEPAQPPSPRRTLRADAKLEAGQLRHATALFDGRTPAAALAEQEQAPEPGYEIVAMERDAFVFDTKTSRFADASEPEWRQQLGAQAEGDKTVGPVAAHRTAASTSWLRPADDSFRWPDSLGGGAVTSPRVEDPQLSGRLRVPELAATASQRDGRLQHDGAPRTGAVVLYKDDGKEKVARLKRAVRTADGDVAYTVAMLVDDGGAVVEGVAGSALRAEPAQLWKLRAAVVKAAAARPPLGDWWDPALAAHKRAAAEAAGYATPYGMQAEKDRAAWEAEQAARRWEAAMFGAEEDEWAQKCAEQEEAAAAAVAEQARLAAEEAERERLVAEQEAARLAAEEEKARLAAEEEERRRLAAAEREKWLAIAAERQAAEDARLFAEEEAARRKAEAQEAARLRAEEEEAARREAEARAEFERHEAARLAMEAEARRRAEEDAAGRQQEQEDERRRKEDEAANLVMLRKKERAAKFRELDGNGSGTLSLNELKDAVKQGKVWPDFNRNNKPALRRALKAADTHGKDGKGDGQLNRKEFAVFLDELVYFNGIWEKFDAVDTGGDSHHGKEVGDGRLSEDEFVAGCATVGLPLSAEEARAEFAVVDADGSGSVLFDEFVTMCARRRLDKLDVDHESSDSESDEEEEGQQPAPRNSVIEEHIRKKNEAAAASPQEEEALAWAMAAEEPPEEIRVGASAVAEDELDEKAQLLGTLEAEAAALLAERDALLGERGEGEEEAAWQEPMMHSHEVATVPEVEEELVAEEQQEQEREQAVAEVVEEDEVAQAVADEDRLEAEENHPLAHDPLGRITPLEK